MRRCERQSRRHIRLQLRHALLRQSEHQIQVYFREQAIRLRQRMFGLIGSMNAPDAAQ